MAAPSRFCCASTRDVAAVAAAAAPVVSMLRRVRSVIALSVVIAQAAVARYSCCRAALSAFVHQASWLRIAGLKRADMPFRRQSADVRFGSWLCENSGAHRAGRNISKKLRIIRVESCCACDVRYPAGELYFLHFAAV